jgi:hypothetical protein
VAAVQPDALFRRSLNDIASRAAFAVVDAPAELAWTGRFLFYRAIDRVLLTAPGAAVTRVTVEESLAGPLLPLFYRYGVARPPLDDPE